MGVGAGLYMYVVVVQKFTFAISSPDEFLSYQPDTHKSAPSRGLHPHAIHILWTHPTQYSKLHLDRFSRFRTAHDIPVLYNVR